MGIKRTLDLNTLRSFVTIAETGSMTNAANRLHMTQSAISMQIKRLEGALDLSVFDRSMNGITPTPSGDQLLHYAKQLLELNDEALVRLTSKDFEGQVSLGVPPDIINPLIPGVLREFSKAYPRVKLQLASSVTRTLLKQFDEGKHDIVITTEPAPGKGGELLSSQRLVWTGAVGGTAWRERPLPIGFTSACAFRVSVIEALDNAGIAWRDVVLAEDEIAANATLAADLCVAAELEYSEHHSSEIISHNGELPELPNHSVVMYRAPSASGTSGSTSGQALGDFIAEAFG